MFESFEKLSYDKRRKITDICIEEFSKYGYQKASTNTMVEKAGISKGILFHYFGSKKRLFLYILDFASNDFYSKVKKCIGDSYTKDILERVKLFTLAKFKASSAVPQSYNELISRTFLSAPRGLEKEIQERYIKYYNDAKSLYFEDIDFNRFREDINIEKTIEMIFFVLEGINHKYLKKFEGKASNIINDFDAINKELDEYLDILRKSFYKNNL